MDQGLNSQSMNNSDQGKRVAVREKTLRVVEPDRMNGKNKEQLTPGDCGAWDRKAQRPWCVGSRR